MLTDQLYDGVHIDRDELRVALGEWHLLTHCVPGHTPAEAVASLRAVTGSTSDAVYALFYGAAEFLERFVDTARRHPDSAPVWGRCADACAYLRAQLPGLARPVLAEVRTVADALPAAADGTCARHERYALLAWCARAARVTELLELIEAEEAAGA